MPCIEAFDSQDAAYRDHVLPAATPKLAIEAATTDSWWRLVRCNGDVIGMNSFGASAPADKLFEHYGFTVDAVTQAALKLL
jgi:transketolase